MKLFELVQLILEVESYEQLETKLGVLGVASEAKLVYLDKKIDSDSDVYIFAIEETDDLIEYSKYDNTFVQLFPLQFVYEFINSDLIPLYINLEAIVDRLVRYRITNS